MNNIIYYINHVCTYDYLLITYTHIYCAVLLYYIYLACLYTVYLLLIHTIQDTKHTHYIYRPTIVSQRSLSRPATKLHPGGNSKNGCRRHKQY